MQVREALPQDKLTRKASPRRRKEEGLTLQMTTPLGRLQNTIINKHFPEKEIQIKMGNFII